MTKRVNPDHNETGVECDMRTELDRLQDERFGWALHCCFGRGANAEEVLQSAYLELLSGRARFGGRSSFKTWLLSVIRNTATDEAQRAIRGADGLTEYQLSVQAAVNDESPGTARTSYERAKQ